MLQNTCTIKETRCQEKVLELLPEYDRLLKNQACLFYSGCADRIMIAICPCLYEEGHKKKGKKNPWPMF